jgi:diguanylate cyclase (GGDEF)-like protein
MVLVLCFDTLIFITGSFVAQPNYLSLLLSGFIGKGFMAVFYSAILTLYLKFFERKILTEDEPNPGIGDVFQLLTFRQKYQWLQEQIKLDPLTSVYNRGYFDDIMPKQIGMFDRLQKPISLIMLDIDFFKRINDRYGHQTGDVVLQQLAGLLSNNIRSSDFLFRYGGEEFAILLPNTPAQAAVNLGNKISTILKTNPRAGDILAETDRITVTMGVACYPEEVENLKELVRLADERLYRGKDAGRNCVFWKKPESGDPA